MKLSIISSLFFFFSLAGYAQKNYNVYVFIAEKCPISIYMAKPLQKAYEKFGEEVEFFAVFPMKNSTEESAQIFLQKHGLSEFKIKLDNYQGFAKKLEASITPEAIVLNSWGEIVYRGRISDAYRAPGKMKHGPRQNELIKVLDLLTVGEPIPQPWNNAVGCYITFH